MTEVLLDAEVDTHMAWFFVHDSDDRFGVPPDEEDGELVVETADGVAVLLGDPDGQGEVRVRVRVLRGAAEAAGELVFDKTLFLYGAGLVVEDGFPSTPHRLDLGGPGRAPVRIILDRSSVPPAVTVVIGDLEPDRSVLPAEPVARRVVRWLRRSR